MNDKELKGFALSLRETSGLNLVRVTDPGFVPENCRTFHDITRFVHQKAMEEMFSTAFSLENKDRLSVRLESNIPLEVYIIHLECDCETSLGKDSITIEEIDSVPFSALWSGIVTEGWPSGPDSAPAQAIATTTGGIRRVNFAEDSFAIISKEYMILSLQMGYHLTTIEAMATEETSKNYIRMQLKQGGASRDRRIRRIQLITDILSAMGFDHHGKGDFLNSSIAYEDSKSINDKLVTLGRLTILTKQLDMALSSDAVADWYTSDMLKILGLYDHDPSSTPNGIYDE